MRNYMNEEIKSHDLYKNSRFKAAYNALILTEDGICGSRPADFYPDKRGKIIKNLTGECE